MQTHTSIKQTKAVLKELRAYVDDGGRLTVAQIVMQYFDPKSPLSAIQATHKVMSWMAMLGKQYNQRGILFCRVNEEGQYGIAKTQEEARYMAVRGYAQAKGTVVSYARRMTNAKAEKLLTATEETLALPKIK